MKVLNCFLDNRFGGPQKRTSSIAGELQKYNIEIVFLFNERGKGNIPIKHFKCFLLKHLQCITRNSAMKTLFLFSLLFPYNFYKIFKIIKSEEIDIIHTNGLINILPALTAKLSNVKVVWHLNDTLDLPVVRKLFLALVESLSHKILIQGKKIGEFHFKNNDRLLNKSITLYPPVNTERLNPDLIDIQKKEKLKIEFNIPVDNFVIGTLGNINRSKGYEYFIKAAKMIKNEIDNVTFLIAGAQLETKQDYWRELKDLLYNLDLEDSIIFAGFREDIPECLSIMNVFVLSSVNESCSNAVLEALAMKVPIVATDVGAVSEQIIHGENGIVVKPRRPDLLADGILKILNLPKKDLEKMVNAGRKRAEEIFSLDIITKRQKDIYEEVLSK